jgi:DNA-binding CsgD family transcriptional regulator
VAENTKGLLERDGVMDAAARLLDQAREGRAGVLFVLAEPGLGKTSVLDAACLLAKDEFSIGLGKGEVMEAALPFGLLFQVVSALGGGDALDGHGAERPAPDRRAARFYEVWRWLESGAPRPALLAIDDLHWADADSLALLSFLCRRMSQLPVAIIATLRPWPDPARRVAEGLAQDGHAAIERLEPLTRDSATALLAEQAGRQINEAAVERAAEICAGNPLLLEQVGLAVARGEEIPHAGDMRGVHDRLLLGRFAGLPVVGLSCARAAAVLGIRFRPELAVRLADLSPREADEALEALDRSGLVRPGRPGWVEFVHPLFRQALYDDLGGSTRVRLHARAFAFLAERGLDEEAAEHAVKADLAGDPAAIAVLHRVGRVARNSGATESAISVLESAVALAGEQASPELLCDLTELLAAGGRPADGKQVGQRVLQLASLPVKIRVRTLEALARAHLFLGEYDAATQRAEECVELAVPVDPEFAVGLLFSYARGINFIAGQAAALPILDRARTVARACDASFRWSAEVAWAYAALVTGDSSGLPGAEEAARAVEAAAATASGRALLVGTGALSTYATIARLTDRLAESEHFFRARLRCAEEAGSPEEVGAALFACAGTLTRMLRLDDGLALTERCAGLADLVPLLAPYAAADRANLLLLSGRLAESEESARRADDLVGTIGGWQPSMNLTYGRAWRSLAEGRLADACTLYEYMEATAKGVGVREPCDLPWARHAMAAYLGAGRRADAERVLAWLEDCAPTLPCRYPRIAIAHGRALLAEDAGDEAAADDLFQRAMAIHEEVDLPLEHLVTLLEYGRFLRRAGQLQRARRPLAQAVDIAEDTGARWLADQARQELRVAGGRRRDKSDPSRLTPQEERVAALAASGASNAEIAGTLFLSVNTVETHLQHIYVKLGVRSRRQLARSLSGATEA